MFDCQPAVDLSPEASTCTKVSLPYQQASLNVQDNSILSGSQDAPNKNHSGPDNREDKDVLDAAQILISFQGSTQQSGWTPINRRLEDPTQQSGCLKDSIQQSGWTPINRHLDDSTEQSVLTSVNRRLEVAEALVLLRNGWGQNQVPDPILGRETSRTPLPNARMMGDSPLIESASGTTLGDGCRTNSVPIPNRSLAKPRKPLPNARMTDDSPRMESASGTTLYDLAESRTPSSNVRKRDNHEAHEAQDETVAEDSAQNQVIIRVYSQEERTLHNLDPAKYLIKGDYARSERVPGRAPQKDGPQKLPIIPYLIYGVLARQPDHKLKLSDLDRLIKDWCPERAEGEGKKSDGIPRPQKEKDKVFNSSLRHALTVNADFANVSNLGEITSTGGYWTLSTVKQYAWKLARGQKNENSLLTLEKALQKATKKNDQGEVIKIKDKMESLKATLEDIKRQVQETVEGLRREWGVDENEEDTASLPPAVPSSPLPPSTSSPASSPLLPVTPPLPPTTPLQSAEALALTPKRELKRKARHEPEPATFEERAGTPCSAPDDEGLIDRGVEPPLSEPKRTRPLPKNEQTAQECTQSSSTTSRNGRHCFPSWRIRAIRGH